MSRSIRLGIRFDLRVPDFAPTDHRTQYAAALDMARWADALDLRYVALSEHHGTSDGYVSAPFTLAAAILAATERIKVNVAAALLPLHDPVRLAEQLATIDLVAPGRLSFVAGAGYRREEFAMAGVERSARGRLLEDHIGVLRAAWTGEPFEWQGRTVVVTPRPVTPGGPRLVLGGSVVASAERAARLHLPLFAGVEDPVVRAAYEAACAAEGYTTGSYSASTGPAFVMVADDVEATWDEIGRHALFDATTYDAWQDRGHESSFQVHGASGIDEVRASGAYRVVTPKGCIELARELGSLTLHPLMGGIPAGRGWEALRLFEREVLPALD